MRRLVWLTFVPILLAIAFFGIMVIAGFMKAFSFGMVDRYELEADLSVIVLWTAFGVSAMTAALSWLFGRRKRTSGSAVILREASSIAFAIFFGGTFALAHAWQTWWAYLIAFPPYLAWVALVEVRRPQETRRRRAWRVSAWVVVPALTAGILHYAAFV